MVDLPPVDVIKTLQDNVVQTLLAALVAGFIGNSRKGIAERFMLTVATFPPSLFIFMIITDMWNKSLYLYVAAVILTSVLSVPIRSK